MNSFESDDFDLYLSTSSDIEVEGFLAAATVSAQHVRSSFPSFVDDYVEQLENRARRLQSLQQPWRFAVELEPIPNPARQSPRRPKFLDLNRRTARLRAPLF